MLVPPEIQLSDCWQRILTLWPALTTAQRKMVVDFHKGKKSAYYQHRRRLRLRLHQLSMITTDDSWIARQNLTRSLERQLYVLHAFQHREIQDAIKTIEYKSNGRHDIVFCSLASPEGIHPTRDTIIGTGKAVKLFCKSSKRGN